ncbi:MAG TPA: hypothetical protein VGD76_02130 [Ramlibacter sp.]
MHERQSDPGLAPAGRRPGIRLLALRALVSDGVFDDNFLQQLLVMVSPVALVVCVALLLVRASRPRHES